MSQQPGEEEVSHGLRGLRRANKVPGIGGAGSVISRAVASREVQEFWSEKSPFFSVTYT